MGIPKYGAAAPCTPAHYPHAQKGMIEWAWFPEHSWLNSLLSATAVIVVIGVVLMVMGQVIAGVIVFLIGFIALWFFLNWHWNANKQVAYKIARGKSIEAMELWEVVDKGFVFMAKDTFFETRYGGKVLRVLRDGTIEVLGSHNDIETGEAGDGVEEPMESSVGKVIKKRSGNDGQVYVTTEQLPNGTKKTVKTTIDQYGNKTIEETLEQPEDEGDIKMTYLPDGSIKTTRTTYDEYGTKVIRETIEPAEV